MLPFTHLQFLDVFAAYNLAVWPAPVVAYGLGLAICAALTRPRGAAAGSVVAGGLALMWAWTGIAYHLLHFSRINPAAVGFGAAFAVEGVLLAFAGWQRRLRFAPVGAARSWLGWALVVYAMALYPLLGWVTGGRYPAVPLFGITPCPVTIFTLGVFALASPRAPWWLLAIPVLWSLIGGTAAWLLHVPQDWVLLFSGLAVAPLWLRTPQANRAGRVE